jgi:hypothetical protein
LPTAERILCLIFGFSKNIDSARFNIKKRPNPHLIPGTGKGTLIKIITFQKKSNVGNDTLFTLCLLLEEFFV